MKCIICEKEFEGYGNNALPVKEGLCCDRCNHTIVIPTRIHVSSRIKSIKVRLDETRWEAVEITPEEIQKLYETTDGKVWIDTGKWVLRADSRDLLEYCEHQFAKKYSSGGITSVDFSAISEEKAKIDQREADAQKTVEKIDKEAERISILLPDKDRQYEEELEHQRRTMYRTEVQRNQEKIRGLMDEIQKLGMITNKLHAKFYDIYNLYLH